MVLYMYHLGSPCEECNKAHNGSLCPGCYFAAITHFDPDIIRKAIENNPNSMDKLAEGQQVEAVSFGVKSAERTEDIKPERHVSRYQPLEF